MIPNYQLNRLRIERDMTEDKVLSKALSSAIRVLETHVCSVETIASTKEVPNSANAFRDNRGETQDNKYGF